VSRATYLSLRSVAMAVKVVTPGWPTSRRITFRTMLRTSRRDPPAPDPSSSPPASPESALLERIRSGDEAAFEHLFRSYYQPLCDFAMSYVRSRETAEELVQTVFLRLWEKRESLRPATGVAAYLFAACRNGSLDHLKHRRVVERTESESSPTRPPPPALRSPRPKKPPTGRS
jgi:hypothetical protein